MRVAIVHDGLVQFGGAERVLQAFMEVFPHAPVYTLLYDPDGSNLQLDSRRIRTSFLQRVPGAKRRHHYLPPLMPMAAESLDLRQFDVVLSSSYAFAKGVITSPHTMHISYCFTPTRYLWDGCHQYVRDFARTSTMLKLAPLGLTYLRLWDYIASQRVDHYLTLSQFVARRIRAYYNREADVIPPPVDVDRFRIHTNHDDYYLIVARLVPYKRVELAIQACEKLGRRLRIAGVGPEEGRLKELAGPHTEFLGFVPDEDLPELYAKSRALLFPQEEDFGITPLEAAASGKPAIAYDWGGAQETIIDNVTGTLFSPQTVAGLEQAIIQHEQRSFDPVKIRQHAEGYARPRFLRAIEEAVHSQWMQYRRHHRTRI